MKIKKFIVLFILFFLSKIVFSLDFIEGYVYESSFKAEKKPVDQACIIIRDVTVYTDKNGYFKINLEQFEKKDYLNISIKKQNFFEYNEMISLFTDNKLEFFLKSSKYAGELDNIFITLITGYIDKHDTYDFMHPDYDGIIGRLEYLIYELKDDYAGSESIRNKALNEIKKGKFDTTKKIITNLKKQVNKSSVNYAKHCYTLAIVNILELQFNKALVIIHEAIETSPANPEYIRLAGDIMFSLKDYENTFYLNEGLIELNKEEYGEEYPGIAEDLCNRSVLYFFFGEYDKALMNAEKALEINYKQNGVIHRMNSIILTWIGKFSVYSDKHIKALSYYREAYLINCAIYGSGHFIVSLDFINIADMMLKLYEYVDAIKYYEKSYAINKRMFGDKHPVTIMNFDRIGLPWTYLRLSDKALEYHYKTYKINTKNLGKEHPSICMILINMGKAYLWSDRNDEAMNCFEAALKISNKNYGEVSHYSAVCLQNIGRVFFSSKNYNEALENYEHSLDLFYKIHGNENLNIAVVFVDIGETIFEMGDKDKGFAMINKGYEMILKVLEPGNPIIEVYRDYVDSYKMLMPEKNAV